MVSEYNTSHQPPVSTTSISTQISSSSTYQPAEPLVDLPVEPPVDYHHRDNISIAQQSIWHCSIQDDPSHFDHHPVPPTVTTENSTTWSETDNKIVFDLTFWSNCILQANYLPCIVGNKTMVTESNVAYKYK